MPAHAPQPKDDSASQARVRRESLRRSCSAREARRFAHEVRRLALKAFTKTILVTTTASADEFGLGRHLSTLRASGGPSE